MSSDSALESRQLLLVRAFEDSRLECEPSFSDGKSLASEPFDNLSLVRPFLDDNDEWLLELHELRGRFETDFSVVPTEDEARPFLYLLLVE